MRNPLIMLWPDSFAPVNMTATIDRPVFKGPKPLDGREQVVSSSAGGWMISYEGIPIYADRIRFYRSIISRTGGFARPVYIKPEFSVNSLARRNNISPILRSFATQNVSFSDGSLFSQSTSDCYLTANAARGATTISVNNSTISPVSAGDYFELSGRVYVVHGIDGQNWSIWPPIREAQSSGERLEIDDPRLLAYVVTDNQALSLNLQYGRIARINIDFIEANW